MTKSKLPTIGSDRQGEGGGPTASSCQHGEWVVDESRRVPTAAYDSTQAPRKVLKLNSAAGQFHNRLLRLKRFVEPLAATDRLHLRPVVLAMNLVVDHVELLMEMHAGLSAATAHST